MIRLLRNWFFSFILVAQLLANCLLMLWEPDFIKVIANNVFDQYQRTLPRKYQDVGVRIIDIDEASLQQIGQWPWPRTIIAELLRTLAKADVSAVGFDIIFAEPDRSSPKQAIKNWPITPELKKQVAVLPDHDRVLADAFKLTPTVLGFSAESIPNDLVMPTRPFRFITVGDGTQNYVQSFNGAITSLPEFEAATSGNGVLNFSPDQDGILRRVPLVAKIRDQLYPSFSAELLRVALGQNNYVLKTVSKNSLGIASLDIDQLSIPTNARGEMWVYYTEAADARVIPAWKVLSGQIAPETLKHTILLLGVSAKGLMDVRYTPVAGIVPGIQVHAQIIEQALSKTFLVRPNTAFAIEFLSMLMGSLWMAWMALNYRAFVAFGWFAGFETLLMVGSWLAFKHFGVLLNAVVPALLIALVFVTAGLIRHFRSEQQQRWIRNAFSRYVSPNLVNYLIANPDQIAINGERSECSFVLTDLANSTAFMEKTEPGQVAKLLNVYLDKMIAIAFKHDGTLTRIIGDGIVIMFSAPVTQPDHRQRAIRCALDMDAFSKQYQAELKAQGIGFCATRIGVNTGTVLVGNFGGQSIFDYRALGDPINTASRLESANRYLGTSMCVAGASLSNGEEFIARPIGRLLLKGKSRALAVYEVLGSKQAHPELQSDSAYEQAYRLLIAGELAVARVAFAELALARPDDGLVHFQLNRLTHGDVDDLIELTEK